ncbi:MAG: hypothetical protein ABI353_05750 [Isosphaeraceae bacterium]
MPPTGPSLPIVTPDFPRRSAAQKYGGLLYLGIAGLVVLIALIARFGYGVWSLRDVFTLIYVVNDPGRPDADRIQSAYTLSRDPRLTQRQRLDLCLSRTPPDLARYLLAESLTSRAIRSDRRAHALAVSRSEGWPDWLRLLLLRPLAYAAGEGSVVPDKPIAELRRHSDPVIALWATYTLAVSGNDDAKTALIQSTKEPGLNRDLARLLASALDSKQPDRNARLNEATYWLRQHHPEAARLWQNWREHDGRLSQESASELPDS